MMTVPKTLNERIAKLPSWAQNHINNQKQHIEHLEREVQKTYTLEETNTYVDRYTLLDDTPLPPNSHIRFKYGPKPWDSFEVVVTHPFAQPDVVDGIEVRTANGTLIIIPQASNSVKIQSAGFGR